MSNENNTLVDSKLALSFFLDSLLKETESPEVVEVAVEPVVSLVVKDEVKVEMPEVEVITETQTVAEVTPEIVVEQPVLADDIELKDSLEVSHQNDLRVAPEEQPAKQIVEIPDEPFQALMFKVAGLSLAVSLVELNGVLEWDESALTEMPGHSPFFMGVIQYLGKSIPIVDTARLVFPADKLVSLSADKPYERVKRIVLIDDGKWGLACDEIAEVVELTPEAVKWRENRSQRKWMAGTVIDHMCALVDASGFSEMLDDGSHNRD